MTIARSVVTLVLLGAGAAHAQEWVPPADTARCPSKWGAGDQRGSRRFNLFSKRTAENSGVIRRGGNEELIFLVVNGVHLVENLRLDELADKRIYEFAFFMQPLKIQGATGSPVVPVAIR
jgi:hypothetical protein